MRVPRWLIAVGVVLAGAGGGLYWLESPPETLTVVSWGDAYGRAQTLALFHPYTDKSGVNVAVRNYGGGLKEIAEQVETRNYEWDVVDLELEDAAAGCRQGLLERLDNIQLPPGIDGAAARRDFVPGALGPCWVGSMVYSQIIAFDPQRFGENQPRTLADFFDLGAVSRAAGSEGQRSEIQSRARASRRRRSAMAGVSGADDAERPGPRVRQARHHQIRDRLVEPCERAHRHARARRAGDDDRFEFACLLDRRRTPLRHHLGRTALSARRVRHPNGEPEQGARARVHPLRDRRTPARGTVASCCLMVRHGGHRSSWSDAIPRCAAICPRRRRISAARSPSTPTGGRRTERASRPAGPSGANRSRPTLAEVKHQFPVR